MSRSRELAELATAYDSGGSFGFRNRIINGQMMIDQRNAGASVTPASGGFTYTLDRWAAYTSQSSKFTVQQNAGSVTPPVGFSKYLGATTAASGYSPISSDIMALTQTIEGLNTVDLAWGAASASSATVSFYVYSSLTGTFAGSVVQNATTNACYVFTYSVSAANTWQRITVTIPGPSIGTWPTNNTGGVQLNFNLGTGSAASTATTNTWIAGTNYFTANSSVNMVATANATFYITGVQLEKGSTATSFDYRPYGTELPLCQRYYYRITNSGNGLLAAASSNMSSTLARATVPFPVPMRAAPASIEQTGTASDYQLVAAGGSIVCSSVPAIYECGTTYGMVNFTVAGGLTSGGASYARVGTTGAPYLGFPAEL